MRAEDESIQSVPNASVASGGEELVLINVRCSNGSKFTVRASLGSTVAEFKQTVAQNCDVPAIQQRVIYKGRILQDDQTLESYGLQADHTVHMVRGSPPIATTPSAAPANVRSTNVTLDATQRVNSNVGGGLGGAGLGASLFPELGGLGLGAGGGNGASGLFGTGLPEFEQVRQQLTQNPNMMRDIINAPAIQNLINNPDLIRNFFMSNPQMREIIDRNPQLGHVLNDPGTLRQALETATNPELRREMMRNTDRAMSNIESSPEGFNMLRRMYENVQEPFLNATTMGGGAGNDVGLNPFAALLGNQGVGNQGTNASTDSSNAVSEPAAGTTFPNSNPLPNPWGNTAGSPTNAAAGSNATGDARAAGTGGVRVLGLDGSMRTIDPRAVDQLLQNPDMSQLIQSVQNMLSDPQYTNQFRGTNPQLQIAINPLIEETIQNPELIRQLISSEMMQTLLSQQNRESTQESTQTGGATGTGAQNMGLDMMNLFRGLGAGGGLTVPNIPDLPPEELYATQLAQLQEMGFYDTQENISALRATLGNVNAAVERLLGNLGQ